MNDPKDTLRDDDDATESRGEVQSLDTVRLTHAEIAAQLREAGVLEPVVDEPEQPPQQKRDLDD